MHTFLTFNQVIVRMKKRRDVKLPEPYTRCQADITPDISPLVKDILESGKKYRQELCFETCTYNYFNEQSIARNMTLYEFKNSISFNAVRNCSYLCPIECEQITYDLTASTKTTSEAYLQDLNKIYKIPTVATESFFEINFCLVDRFYFETKQIPKVTLTDFVSNSGGLLGLFLGMSFISVYHFLLLLYDKVSAFISK